MRSKDKVFNDKGKDFGKCMCVGWFLEYLFKTLRKSQGHITAMLERLS